MARQRENPLSSYCLYRGSTGRILAVLYENIDRGLDYTGSCFLVICLTSKKRISTNHREFKLIGIQFIQIISDLRSEVKLFKASSITFPKHCFFCLLCSPVISKLTSLHGTRMASGLPGTILFQASKNTEQDGRGL